MGILVAVFTLCLVMTVESGSSPCSRGETYWCSQLKTALGCGAIHHCMSTVWKNGYQPANASVDSAVACNICKGAVSWFGRLVKSHKGIINSFLDDACDTLPIKPLAFQCKTLVKIVTGAILDMVVKILNSNNICSLIRFCTKEDYLVEKPVDNVEKLCNDCTCFFTDLRDHVTTKEMQQRMIKYVEKTVCSLIRPAMVKYCNMMVNAYVPEFFELIATQFRPRDLCKAIGFCQGNETIACTVGIFDKLIASFEPNDSIRSVETGNGSKVSSLLWDNGSQPRTIRSVSGSGNGVAVDLEAPFCRICQILVQSLDDALRKNSTEQIIKMVLKELCKQLPTKMIDKCTFVVGKYATAVMQIIAHFADPFSVCKAAQMCEPRKVETNRSAPPLLQCSNGSGFWCDNIANAIRCNALRHCMEQDWKN